MTKLRYFFIIIATSFFTGCNRGSQEPTTPKRNLNGAPIGAVVSPRAGTFTGDKLSFFLDLYVVDEDGNFVDGLKNEDVSITGVSTSVQYSLQNLQGGRLNNKGDYSAMMLMDQSGSILDTDPDDLRIDASRIFIKALGRGDHAGLAAFSNSYSGSFQVLSGFTQDTTKLLPPLDALANTEGGGTPLYVSSNAMVDYTATNGPTSNKAVIIFTDGEDTQGRVTISQLVANAKSKNVQLYTVGLGTGIRTSVLAEIAAKGDGSFIFASEAKQLITAFGTLGDLLSGNSQIYKSTWEAVNRSRAWRSGDILNASVSITIPGTAKPIVLPFQIVVN